MTPRERDIIDEVLNYAITDGSLSPEVAEEWTDEQKIDWYDDMFVWEREIETPF